MTHPLHERIRSDIERRILSGKLAPGARLPTEQDYMAAYGCARMTVNRALTALASAGLIVRRKRAGTFVARPETHSMLFDIPDLERDVRGRGETYRFELTRRTVRRARTGAEREWAGAAKLLVIHGVHCADGAPFALERRLINIAAAPEAECVDWRQQSPGAWLLDHVPWTQAESRVTAVNADAEIARRLDVPLRDACLVVTRRTWRASQSVTQVRQIFAPGAIDLVARFGPARV